MSVGQAQRNGDLVDRHHQHSDSARIRARGSELRSKYPHLSDGQLRHLLQREGFQLGAIQSFLRGDDQEPERETHTEKKPPAAPGAPARGKQAAGGALWESPGTASGVLLALVCYPAFLAYLRGGPDGLKAWFRAKFLNQTETDPGIANEAWLSTGSAGGTAATSITGRRRARGGTSASSGAGAAAVAFARGQIGKPYKWGGDGTNGGWDCSGLSQAAWRAAGVKIPRTTEFQILLPAVRRADMQPGDLVFPDPGHVQIYAGGDQIIEAPRLGLNVRQAKLGVVMAVRRPRSRGVAV